MCGEDLPPSAYADRFGALAVLTPTPPSSPPLPAHSQPSSHQPQSLSGNIIFYNKGDPDSQLATHLRFTPFTGTLDSRTQWELFVTIHSLGDLTAPAEACSPSDGIRLWPGPTAAATGDSLVDLQLKEPLYLHVGRDRDGNDGIIGRRISVCSVGGLSSRQQGRVLAEGIVGFNSLPRQQACL